MVPLRYFSANRSPVVSQCSVSRITTRGSCISHTNQAYSVASLPPPVNEGRRGLTYIDGVNARKNLARFCAPRKLMRNNITTAPRFERNGSARSINSFASEYGGLVIIKSKGGAYSW